MSLTTVVQGLDQGFAVLVTVIPVAGDLVHDPKH